MNYYTEIENYIKRNEVKKKARILEENQSTLENYWNIGRILVETQGGEKRAKYGNGLIKEWAMKYSEKYGPNYSYANMARFKQFYLLFPILAPVERLSWTNMKIILPIKEENKRNYYINLCLSRNLSKRELEKEIKNNSYERLANKPEKIEINTPLQRKNIFSNIKNPILLALKENKEIKNEKDLEIAILAQLTNFFTQLWSGYTFVDNQYKIICNNQNYYIDLLLFNYHYNCFVVIELKYKELKREDKAQIEFYMEQIDKQIKEDFHNKTIGIIISKRQKDFIVHFVKKENLTPITYEIIK